MRKNQYKNAKKPVFSLKKIRKESFVVGVDEAGRGSWAGPVVAACVLWMGKTPLKNILRDSKKMTAQDRHRTYEEILHLGERGVLIYGVGIMEYDMIDALGIREANRRAMESALVSIKNKTGDKLQVDFLLVDGRDNYHFDIGVPEPEYIVRGDDIVPQIMAASIIAKVTRDMIMIEYEHTFPGYGFAQHKGYGTELHQKALEKLGVCQIHRKTYAPIRLASSGKSL